MSSDDPPPPRFTLTPPETPLDLTTPKRGDVDDETLIAVPYGRHSERQMSLPTNLDYQYGQLQNRMLYTGDSSDTSSGRSPYSSQNDLSPASSATTSRSGAPSPTFYANSS